MTRRQFLIHAIFFVIILSLNLLYFYIFFTLLQWQLSLLNFAFVFIGALSYFLLLNVLRKLFWQIICHVAISSFFLWSLINFAYFKIFRSFVSMSAGQMSQVNFNFASNIKEFYYLVPWELYVAAILILIGVVINSLFYFNLSKTSIQKILFSTNTSIVYLRKNERRLHHILYWIIIFVVVNILAFIGCGYLAATPRSSWSDVATQATDLGVWGHLYTQVFAKMEGRDQAKSESNSFFTDTTNVYKELTRLSKGDETKAVLPLPTFDKKPNILMIQLESVGNWAIDNEPTPMPFLKSLIANNISIPHFYSNGCETINAEFAALCSFWPDSYSAINFSHKKTDFRCLPQVLSEKYDYNTYLFHSDVPEFWDRNVMSPKWGMQNLFFSPYYKLKADDNTVFQDALGTLQKSGKPFLGYLISFTTHSPHNQAMIDYNKYVNNLIVKPFTGDLGASTNNVNLDEETLRTYLGFLTATDDALRNLFSELEKTGLDKNTIVVIYDDHRFYNFEGEETSAFIKYNEIPFVIVLPSKEKGELAPMASQIDIAPTILNMIEGNDYRPEPNFIGTSLYSPDYVPEVVNKCLGNVYYKNSELTITGNAKTDLFDLFTSSRLLPTIEKDNWLTLVKKFVFDSDEALFTNDLVK